MCYSVQTKVNICKTIANVVGICLNLGSVSTVKGTWSFVCVLVIVSIQSWLIGVWIGVWVSKENPFIKKISPLFS